jgi:hypothetical protein
MTVRLLTVDVFFVLVNAPPAIAVAALARIARAKKVVRIILCVSRFDLEDRIAEGFGTLPECAVHLPFIFEAFLTGDCDGVFFYWWSK